jgi:hypothetical protein
MKVAFSTRTSVNHPIVLGILYYCMMMGVPEITEQYIFLCLSNTLTVQVRMEYRYSDTQLQ